MILNIKKLSLDRIVPLIMRYIEINEGSIFIQKKTFYF